MVSRIQEASPWAPILQRFKPQHYDWKGKQLPQLCIQCWQIVGVGTETSITNIGSLEGKTKGRGSKGNVAQKQLGVLTGQTKLGQREGRAS